MTSFYDQLAPYYHLIYPDWDTSVRRQGAQLAELVAAEWPAARRVLDVSCGIGTQAIGLALQGFDVHASDLSAKEVERARREAARFGVDLALSVCDMREAAAHHGSGFDTVISCDNALPHLLTDQDLLSALREMAACVTPGGGCLITVRDYDQEPKGKNLVKPYGVRVEGSSRYLLFQVWDFEGEHYDLSFYLVSENLETGEVTTQASRSRNYAVSMDRLCDLMRQAGLTKVRRLDGVFFQPVLLGTRG